MIKFRIFKGEKDESEIVFIQEEENEKQKLVFQVIQALATSLLIKSINKADTSYKIEVSDKSLESYKEIVKTVFESVIKDEELKELYKEASELEKQLESKDAE